jgi:hypothetical protein
LDVFVIVSLRFIRPLHCYENLISFLGFSYLNRSRLPLFEEEENVLCDLWLIRWLIRETAEAIKRQVGWLTVTTQFFTSNWKDVELSIPSDFSIRLCRFRDWIPSCGIQPDQSESFLPSCNHQTRFRLHPGMDWVSTSITLRTYFYCTHLLRNNLQYAGLWYEVERFENVFQQGMTCVRAIYEEIGKNSLP